MTTDTRPSVLFVCIHNAGRSQMGAAYTSHLSHGAVEVRFDAPVRAVAPGQAVVFYGGEQVLGGAWIEGALA